MTPQEEERDAIVERLHKLVGVCGHCRKPKCKHVGYSVLPEQLKLDDVLAAINDDIAAEARD